MLMQFGLHFVSICSLPVAILHLLAASVTVWLSSTFDCHVHLFCVQLSVYICYIQISFVMHICPRYNCHKHTVCINTIDLKTNLRRF